MSEPDPHLDGSKLFGLDPGELLARALAPAHPSKGGKTWEPPSPEQLSNLLPQFQIESLIGAGGMGAVYRGRQVSLDRPVAIKVLPPELAEDEQFVLRFQRESRTLAKLHHPGIVAVYESGQTSKGHLYFVMEFVEGTDLRHILRTQKLDSNQVLELICQICNALQAAHKLGIIHRDIKPENILISNEGDVKLVDFGLSRPTTTESIELTMSNVVMGTPDYMSPEQKEGNTDHRTDIYALGILLYEMLTGKPPRGAFDPPSHKVQVDVRLDEIVLKALQEEPDRRYQQVTELKTAVDDVRCTPLPLEEPPILEEAIFKPAKSEALAPRLIGTALTLAVLIGGVLIWAPWRHEKKPETLLSARNASMGPVSSPTNPPSTPPTIAPVVGAGTPSAVTINSNPANPDFKISTNDGEIKIGKYIGLGGDVHIPNIINGLPVTSIEGAAFQRCKTLTSVSIPESVTSIGNYAFEENSALREVTIPASVMEIGQGAFGNCRNLVSINVDVKNPNYSTSPEGILFNKDQTTIVAYPAGNTNSSYEIPKSVTTIKNRAINGCANLISVIIPDSVTSIGGDAFTGCSNLVSAIIPDSVTTIERFAFFRCVNLQSVRIPNALNIIETGLFDGCRKLENITIPNSVSSIGNNSFNYCQSLTAISIPSSVTNIGDAAFNQCPKLKSVVFQGNAPMVGTNAFKNTAPDFKVYYKADAKGFTSPFWTDSSGGRWPSEAIVPPPAPTPTPDPITWVHDHSAHMPREVILEAPLSFPILIEGVTKGSVTAPAGSHVHVMNLQDGKLTVQWNGNSQTASLEQTDFRKRAEAELARALAAPTATPFIAIKTEQPKPTPPSNPPASLSASQSSSNTAATSDFTTTTNDGVIIITGYTGSGGDLQIPSTINGFPVTGIKAGAFNKCTRLTSVSIPDGITDIGWVAFEKCLLLTNVSIPSSVTTIAGGAFGQCPKLTSFQIKEDNPKFSTNSTGVLFNKDQTAIVAYPPGKTNTSYEIPKGVATIENLTFNGCSNLSSVVIPDTVNSIIDGAFYKCSNLKSITLPNSVTAIGGGAFSGCNSLTNITIPNSITSIAGHCFEGCGKLATVSIPAGVTNIGESSFAGCHILKSITFQGNSPTVGTDSFKNTASDFKVYYKSGATGFTSPLWTNSSGGKLQAQVLP